MNELTRFIQSQETKKIESTKVDWASRKTKWLRELDTLFVWIRESLTRAGLDTGSVAATTCTISEETLGTYQAPAMEVTLPAGVHVQFKPIASVIVGGYGRIDVTACGLISVRLIAQDADQARDPDDSTPPQDRRWIWQVYPSRGIRSSFPLDEAGLARLLESVA